MKKINLILLFLGLSISSLCYSDDFAGFTLKGSCNLYNPNSVSQNTCACVQDTSTKTIWLAVNSEGGMSWDGSTGTSIGVKEWIKRLNSSEVCGIRGGWSLPNLFQLQTLVSRSIDWFNNSGFIDIDAQGEYWGEKIDDGVGDTALILSIPSGIINIKKLAYNTANTHVFAVHYPVSAADLIPGTQ
ncbi:MAG: hypothetical protein K0R94_1709 [Burkholderiales bacterium]|jgi:hypothetical protein|nr:hypothetical protein [Burkholderiales bacterium]